MTTPVAAVQDEVRALISIQIETLGQPAPITSSQLSEYHDRWKKIRSLCDELDRLGTEVVISRRLKKAC
ncbi:MAG: hypothetical protein WBW53_16150 [Terriglobales bacterium]